VPKNASASQEQALACKGWRWRLGQGGVVVIFKLHLEDPDLEDVKFNFQSS
jgi:hypothetical protein